MNWSDIIKQILAVVGPLLKAWLERWLEDLLKRAAVRHKRPPQGSTRHAALDLLELAEGELWFWQFAKRRLISRLAAVVPDYIEFGTLPDRAAADIRALAAKCE